jgi:hypothetical protein
VTYVCVCVLELIMCWCDFISFEANTPERTSLEEIVLLYTTHTISRSLENTGWRRCFLACLSKIFMGGCCL